MTEHVSWILTTREKLTDGRTPYQLARGSKFNREGLPFAESVYYKLNAGQLKRAGDGKLEPRWAEGVFLGYARDSYEYAVWDSESNLVELSRSIKRLPESERRKVEPIERIEVRPQDLPHRAAWRSVVRRERSSCLRLSEEDQGRVETRETHVQDLFATFFYCPQL